MADISGKDLAYRALASALGGPVDLTTMVMRPFGYAVGKPVLGSEWIGQKMEQSGLVSDARDPLKEFAASIMVPSPSGAATALAKGSTAMPMLLGMLKPGMLDVGKISSAAKRGLTEYQAAMYGSEVGGYSTLQKFLRTGSTKNYGTQHNPEVLQALVAGIDDGLANSVLKQPVVLYRGVRDARPIFGPKLENLKVGHVFQDAGYLSTTTDKKVAGSKFGEALNRGDRPLVFQIQAPPGLNAFDMDTIEKIGEKEVLLPRNLPLEIKAIKGNTVIVEPVIRPQGAETVSQNGIPL